MASSSTGQSPRQQQHRITQLPGENSFHARDGSLTKKKREQWEKEKAESDKHSWFPFGCKSLLTGRRTAKKAEKEQQREHNDNQDQTGTTIGSTEARLLAHQDANNNANIQQQSAADPHHAPGNNTNNNNNSSAAVHHQQPTIMEIPPPAVSSSADACLHYVNYPASTSLQQMQYTAPPPMVPIFMDFPPQPQLYHPVPSLYPIQTAQFAAAAFSSYPTPITFSGPATTFLDPFFLPPKVPVSVLTPPFSGSSSSDSATSPPKEGQRNEHRREVEVATFGGPVVEDELACQQQNTNRRWKEELDQQMAERRMSEQLEEERRLEQQKVLEREEQEVARKEEEQRAMEERMRTHKFEIRDQCEQACLDGIQRAQREAEMLKRAKVYRHILLDGQADLETAKKVLKAEEDQMVRDVLKQLRDLELHRRLSTEVKVISPGNGRSPKSTTPPTHVQRAKDTSAINSRQSQSPVGLFNRANSWNVRQPRTIPQHSLLPVPVRQRQQQKPQMADVVGTSVNGSARMMASSRPPKAVPAPAAKPQTSSERKNSTNSVGKQPPPGLFEQLTLRRSRQGSLGPKDMLRLLEQQQQQKSGSRDQCQRPHSDLNGNSGANLSKNWSAHTNSLVESPQNSNNNNNENGNNSVASSSSSTQPNSPGSSSLETASVLKFRALLLSPAESQEDLTADLPPMTSTFRTPVGSTSRNGGGFLAPPSPFSRKNGTKRNEGEDKDCFGDQGMRRSLRSPTMRRLQDSLQSLATIDGAEGTSDSRASTPKLFNCRGPQYRSFNLRRETARQKQVLEHLAAVRAQLKNSQVNLERTISKQNVATSSEEGDVQL